MYFFSLCERTCHGREEGRKGEQEKTLARLKTAGVRGRKVSTTTFVLPLAGAHWGGWGGVKWNEVWETFL